MLSNSATMAAPAAPSSVITPHVRTCAFISACITLSILCPQRISPMHETRPEPCCFALLIHMQARFQVKYLHPTPYTPHPRSYALHPMINTQYPTPDPAPDTRHPTPEPRSLTLLPARAHRMKALCMCLDDTDQLLASTILGVVACTFLCRTRISPP